jgi:acetyl esterase/lipase
MAFHPELQAASHFLPTGVGRPWLVKVMRWMPAPRSTLPEGLTVEEHQLGSAAVRVIGPRLDGTLRPVVIWIHGGGYVIGAARQDDALCARLAKRLDAVVVNVEYRLAPEHPFPAPLDDCLAAFDFVHANAQKLGVDVARIAIAGQSAGGGLAAGLVLRIHDLGRPMPKFQLLLYPMLDDRTVLKPVDDRQFRVWDSRSNRLGWTAYLGRDPGSPDVSDHAAPGRRDDLSGLPSTWIGVGSRDLFHDEDVAYAARLRSAGVPTSLDVIEGAFHGFDALLPGKPVSRDFFERQVRALEAGLK